MFSTDAIRVICNWFCRISVLEIHFYYGHAKGDLELVFLNPCARSSFFLRTLGFYALHSVLSGVRAVQNQNKNRIHNYFETTGKDMKYSQSSSDEEEEVAGDAEDALNPMMLADNGQDSGEDTHSSDGATDDEDGEESILNPAFVTTGDDQSVSFMFLVSFIYSVVLLIYSIICMF